MKKLLLTLVILFLFTLYLSADTYIPEGDVSGTWELAGSPFYIEGEITIPVGETLFIEPGVEVIFNGHYKFIINGIIEAMGTETDFILFTAANTTEGWHSLRFYDAHDFSHLSYCIIEYGRATGEIPDSHGGGIYCENSNPVITYCTIIGNFAESSAGGIGCSNSNPEILDCMISGNVAGVSGGGIFCEGSNPQILNCTITNNNSLGGGLGQGGGGITCSLNSEALISYCTITGNMANHAAGGIGCSQSDAIIEYCNISGNTACDCGGGIVCYLSNATVEYCNISGNTAPDAGGIYVNVSSPTIRRCIVTGNSATQLDGGGLDIAYNGANPIIENCTISGNEAFRFGSQIDIYTDAASEIRNTIIEGSSTNELVRFYNASPDQELTYCDFFNSGTGGNFAGNVPTGLGDITTVNANGDPCDTFMNIFLDPYFVFGYFYLTEGSPCIDAGDPESPLDPDETIADIGRFYFPQTGIDDNEIVQNNIYLHQNYPNPFNPSTTISFNVAQNAVSGSDGSSFVTLEIYNIKGQKVKQLVSNSADQLSAGQHSVVWDGRDNSNKPVSSGIYFYKLKTGNYEKTKKMVLMK
jgi:hypothetical protein